MDTSTDYIDWLNRTVWMDGCDIAVEFDQASDEGRDLSELRAEFDRLLAVPRPSTEWNKGFGGERGPEWVEDALRLVAAVQNVPTLLTWAYREPNDLVSIKAARSPSKPSPTWNGSSDDWLRRLHGGLLGRICGCMLGKPVEAWMRRDIELLGLATDNWPIVDYWRTPTPADLQRLASLDGSRIPAPWMRGCVKDGLHGGVEDDDINYTVIGFAVLKKYGPNFTPLDIAEFWCQNLPILHTCTAERVAYRNFVANVFPPFSATRLNPYREWIGAQIRADYFGYANPGRPERAAEWAWRDASISHVANGIYGEMWVAAMIAAAYVESELRAIIDSGLAQIPERCRLREDIDTILHLHSNGATYDDAVAHVHAQWDERKGHHWCHTNSNAQIVAIGLLYGDDDYEQTITRAVMPGFDTDCNAATCGSIWGIRHGIDAVPLKWTAPIDDIVRTGVAGYHETSVSELAKEMWSVALEWYN